MSCVGILFIVHSSRGGHQIIASVPPNGPWMSNHDQTIFASILGPKPSLCNRKFMLLMDNYVFLGHPVDMNGFMFHLVLTLSGTTTNTDTYYEHVVLPFTRGLKFEQERRSYVQKQTDLILHWRESNTLDLAHLSELEELSTLVRDLVKVYRGLTQKKSISLDINDSMHLTLFAPASGTSDDDMPALRPFHAILLLQEPEEILASLPPDASPSLVEFIRSVTPMQSFEELQVVLDCSLAHVYRLASHLIHWKKGKLIHHINSKNVYIVSPMAPLEHLATLSLNFATIFNYSSVELTQLLALFSTPRPLSSLIPREKRVQYLEMVSFLLQNDLIVQLHMYISIMIPRNLVKIDFPTSEPIDILDDMEDIPTPHHEVKSNYIIPNPAKATEEEQDALQSIADSQNEPWRGLFLQLVEYFDGSFCVEEIMFREKVSRRDMKTLLNRYRDHIITTFHE